MNSSAAKIKHFKFILILMGFLFAVIQPSCKTPENAGEKEVQSKQQYEKDNNHDSLPDTPPREVMAYPDTIKYELPDGYILLMFLKGDEHKHIATTIDSYTIILNDEGYYEYAIKNEDGEYKMSGITARNPGDRSSEELIFLDALNNNE